MAKGNLFLGTAAKSVGDVVMYRREGSQVSRVRVRKIANPKTDAQCRQRAIMNAVVKFYQPLADVLERSWQGMSRAKSYAKFLKANAAFGRANNFYLAKGAKALCFPYQLSSGSMKSIYYYPDTANEAFNIELNHENGFTLTTIGNLSTLFVNNGYQNGDVVTIIIWSSSETFNLLQFEIDTTSEALLTTFNNVESFSFADEGEGDLRILLNTGSCVAGAVIIAREKDGSWLRTTSSVRMSDTELAKQKTEQYIKTAIDSFSNTVGDTNPLVYLDGDELQ